MNTHIMGLHLDVTPALRERIEQKLSRIQRHSDDVMNVHITLSTEKTQHKAAAQVHLTGKDVHVEAVESEMYAAIDMLMDKLDRAILQHKEKSNRF